VGLPGLVVMELLQGCRTLDEQQRVEALLHPYTLYWPTQTDCARALADFMAYHLSHSLGLLDSLIAETAIGLVLLGLNEPMVVTLSEAKSLGTMGGMLRSAQHDKPLGYFRRAVLGVTLATFNEKHYSAVSALKTLRPYSR